MFARNVDPVLPQCLQQALLPDRLGLQLKGLEPGDLVAGTRQPHNRAARGVCGSGREPPTHARRPNLSAAPIVRSRPPARQPEASRATRGAGRTRARAAALARSVQHFLNLANQPGLKAVGFHKSCSDKGLLDIGAHTRAHIAHNFIRSIGYCCAALASDSISSSSAFRCGHLPVATAGSSFAKSCFPYVVFL